MNLPPRHRNEREADWIHGRGGVRQPPGGISHIRFGKTPTPPLEEPERSPGGTRVQRPVSTQRSQKWEYNTHAEALKNLEDHPQVHNIIRSKQERYREELKEQIRIRDEKREMDRRRLQALEARKMEEMKNYYPFGKMGGGAPLRDVNTNALVTSIRGSLQNSKMSEIRSRKAKTAFSPRLDPMDHPPQDSSPRNYPSQYYSQKETTGGFQSQVPEQRAPVHVKEPSSPGSHTRYHADSLTVEEREDREAKKMRQQTIARELQAQLLDLFLSKKE